MSLPTKQLPALQVASKQKNELGDVGVGTERIHSSFSIVLKEDLELGRER